MQAHHVLRTLRKAGDLVDVQRRGVGRQDGTRLHHAVELFENGFFDADFFKYGFDHQVGIAQIVVAQRGAQQRHALVVFVLLAGTSGILDAARSAKNRWRSERDSGVHIRLMNSSRSYDKPSANLRLVAASTASTHLSGAGKFFDIPLTMLRAN